MKSGKELILATRPFAKDSPVRSWWSVLSTAFLLLAALVGTLWSFHLVGRLVCSVLAGLLMLRLFVIYHDQQHGAILSKSRVAEVFMRIYGLVSLSPSSVWNSSHNHHHNCNSKLRGSHIGSFPIMTKAQFLKASRGDRFKYLFMRHPLTILFGYISVFLFGMCLYPFYNNPVKHYDSLLALILHLGIGAALLCSWGWPALIFAQVIPHFVASALGSYLFYAQHNFPTATFQDNAGWTYEGAALESSSCLRANRFLAWVTANIGYHHVHHLNARIPFYRLPEVIRAIPELQNPKTTSLSPREIIRCLRLKVWDVEAQRMVSLRGFPSRREAGRKFGRRTKEC